MHDPVTFTLVVMAGTAWVVALAIIITTPHRD